MQMETKKRSEAQELLSQVKVCDMHINEKLEELAHLRAMTTKITATLKPDAAFGSGNQDKLGDAIAKIVDLENEINRAVDEYVDKRRYASSIVEKVQDPDQLAVLYKRYFQYEPWEKIACDMGFTYRHTTRIHGLALNAVNNIIKTERCPKMSLNVPT